MCLHWKPFAFPFPSVCNKISIYLTLSFCTFIPFSIAIESLFWMCASFIFSFLTNSPCIHHYLSSFSISKKLQPFSCQIFTLLFSFFQYSSIEATPVDTSTTFLKPFLEKDFSKETFQSRLISGVKWILL